MALAIERADNEKGYEYDHLGIDHPEISDWGIHLASAAIAAMAAGRLGTVPAGEVTPAMLDAAMDAWDCSSGDERGRMWNAVEAALRQAIDPRP